MLNIPPVRENQEYIETRISTSNILFQVKHILEDSFLNKYTSGSCKPEVYWDWNFPLSIYFFSKGFGSCKPVFSLIWPFIVYGWPFDRPKPAIDASKGHKSPIPRVEGWKYYTQGSQLSNVQACNATYSCGSICRCASLASRCWKRSCHYAYEPCPKDSLGCSLAMKQSFSRACNCEWTYLMACMFHSKLAVQWHMKISFAFPFKACRECVEGDRKSLLPLSTFMFRHLDSCHVPLVACLAGKALMFESASEQCHDVFPF